jgi:hypothetical protein
MTPSTRVSRNPRRDAIHSDDDAALSEIRHRLFARGVPQPGSSQVRGAPQITMPRLDFYRLLAQPEKRKDRQNDDDQTD